ncbi:TPA: acetyltransferase [Vibrio cholerae]|uniref:acetyltransferase n=1 Tax=Vibrio cholerae TaxID=666 RepID=UPI00053C9B23|nr:acetyltransferase [Vibrio cholerae]TXZ11020.1 acetyltransferase [Vibrio cholerae]TYA67761.1 acetyltransferase [Vibrio cholerae]BCK22163.1 Putative acetyltransferase EpsM [Vibrio cholerae]BCN20738.1 putative acetyltransferase [Vibrio cholerae]HDL8943966.1 acetyltransferase [Vibrio cholerae]
MNKHKPLILIGGGGHASVLADILLGQRRDIVAVISPNDLSSRAVFTGLVHLTQDEEVKRFSPDSVYLVNGIGMLPRSTLRQRVNQQFLELGYQFETVIASDAHVSRFATIHSGAQILSGARVQTGAVVGEHTIVNSGALVEHDCQIGAYNHIAPNATLCGDVLTEENVYIGANATVIQGLALEAQSTVGAGAILTQSLPLGGTCYPARACIK